jgi:hypothetical protein
MRALLLLCVLSLPAAPVPAQIPPRADSSRVVQTNGYGLVRFAADYVTITIEVTARDSSGAVAAEKSTARLRGVLDSLKAVAMPAESISVVALTVRRVEDRQRGIVVGFDAESNVRAVIRQLDRIGIIVDAALRGGATGLNDVAYRSDHEAEHRREAIAIATADARGYAEALACASGVQLGAPVRATTTANCNGYLSLAEEWR